MALVRSKENASMQNRGMVRMYANEAYEYALTLINNWKPESEVIHLKYGAFVLPMLSAIPGLLIAAKIRRFYKIHRPLKGYVAAAIVTVAASGGTNFGAMIQLHRDTVLGTTPCSVCMEIRGFCQQMLLGVGLSSLIGIAGMTHLLSSDNWIRFSIFSKEYVRWFGSMLYKSRYILLVNGSIQGLVWSYIFMSWLREWTFILETSERNWLAEEEERLKREKQSNTNDNKTK